MFILIYVNEEYTDIPSENRSVLTSIFIIFGLTLTSNHEIKSYLRNR